MAMSGMELMLGNMLKGMGIDKDSLLAQAEGAKAIVYGMDQRFTGLEAIVIKMASQVQEIHDRTCGPRIHVPTMQDAIMENRIQLAAEAQKTSAPIDHLNV